MIISASRRTDIPAYYSEWFFNRIKAEEVLVRNPMNHHQVSRVRLSKDLVDCFVFWTKNPGPMLSHLDLLEDRHYYFTYTLNPYGRPVENSLPPLEQRLKTFKLLAKRLGPEGVVWRYDPIIINADYNQGWHHDQFTRLARSLEGSTNTCVFSFMRPYPKIRKRIQGLNMVEPSQDEMMTIIGDFAEIGKKHGIALESCSEQMDFGSLDVKGSKCIDDGRISRLIGHKIHVEKDKNQREVCGCVKSIDIGTYNTCHHDCIYCYANFSQTSVKNNTAKHEKGAAFMIGGLEVGDKVTDRAMESYIIPEQLKLDI